jgi:hypothetical protein
MKKIVFFLQFFSIFVLSKIVYGSYADLYGPIYILNLFCWASFLSFECLDFYMTHLVLHVGHIESGILIFFKFSFVYSMCSLISH